jgi:pimeloyl-ACP methyl ester carboxylesterase
MKRKILWASCLLCVLLLVAAGGTLFFVLHRVQGAYLDVDGVRIHYTDEGQGAPVVLVHGLGAQADWNWRRPGIVRMLRQDFRVVMFDLRGHGLSGKPHDPDLYGEEMARDILRVMDHLGIERALIAGYSLGGFITLKAVTEHPERFIAAVYCASGWRDPEDGEENIPSPFRPPPPEALLPPRAAASGDQRTVSRLVDAVRDGLRDLLFDRQAGKALKKSYPELMVTREAIEANAVPSLCLIGSRDGLLPLARDMEAHMARLELVLVDGANHINTPVNREFKRRLHAFLLLHRPDTQGETKP